MSLPLFADRRVLRLAAAACTHAQSVENTSFKFYSMTLVQYATAARTITSALAVCCCCFSRFFVFRSCGGFIRTAEEEQNDSREPTFPIPGASHRTHGHTDRSAHRPPCLNAYNCSCRKSHRALRPLTTRRHDGHRKCLGAAQHFHGVLLEAAIVLGHILLGSSSTARLPFVSPPSQPIPQPRP